MLNEPRTALEEFITVGLDEDQERAIGALPTGNGVLGLLILDPEPLRLANLGEHPDMFGFPPDHPVMRSFLGVPVRVRNAVYGNLYLTEKEGLPEFSEEDEWMVSALAVAAGIAIENARLHGRVRELALTEDRDRIARDLHDTVIQRLFAVGLSLQAVAPAARPPNVAERIGLAVKDLDEIIAQLRTAIFDLQAAVIDDGLRREILNLVRELTPVVGSEPKVILEGPIDAAVTPEAADHLLATLREALTNVGKHAEATTVTVSIEVDEGLCLVVQDNGRGLPDRAPDAAAQGVRNLQRRAEKLSGTFDLRAAPDGGTRLEWRVPL